LTLSDPHWIFWWGSLIIKKEATIMPWYEHKHTGMRWHIEDPRGVEIAEITPELTEVDGPHGEPIGAISVPPNSPEPQDDPSESVGDMLDTMQKSELIELAKSMGIPTSGKNMDQLKRAIREAE
jgi:hypothetical protein